MSHICQLDESTSQKLRSHANYDGLQEILRTLLKNATKAGATKVQIKTDLDSLSVCVEDNGAGIEGVLLRHIAEVVKPRRDGGILQGVRNGSQVKGANGLYLYSSQCCSCCRKGDPGVPAANVEGTKADFCSGACISCSGTCSSRESEDADKTKLENEQTGLLVHGCKFPMGYKGGTLRTLLQMCSNFALLSTRNGAKSRACGSQNLGLVDVLAEHFGALNDSRGTTVILSRLFSHLPVRARYVKENLTQEKLINDLKEIVFEEIIGNSPLEVKVGFVRQQWSFHATSTRIKPLFIKLVGGTSPKFFSSEKNGFALEGAACASTQTMQLVFLNGKRAFPTQKHVLTLRQVLKNTFSFQFSYYICVNGLDVAWDDVIVTIKGLLEYEKTPLPKKKRVTVSPARNSDHFASISVQRDDLDNLRVISQVENLFVLASSGAKLLAIDPHACDERIRLEMLLKETLESVADPTVDLRVPCEHFEIPVTSEESAYFQNHREQFAIYGIDYEAQPKSLKITHLNHYLQRKSLKNHLLGLFPGKGLRAHTESFRESMNSDWILKVREVPEILVDAIAQRSCRLSVKFGQNLTQSEILLIVASLKKCYLPFQCAHGRPTIFPLSSKIEHFNGDYEL